MTYNQFFLKSHLKKSSRSTNLNLSSLCNLFTDAEVYWKQCFIKIHLAVTQGSLSLRCSSGHLIFPQIFLSSSLPPGIPSQHKGTFIYPQLALALPLPYSPSSVTWSWHYISRIYFKWQKMKTYFNLNQGLKWMQECEWIWYLNSPLLWLTWTSLVAQTVKNLTAIWETQVRSLGQEDPLENGVAAHSSILAWRIPWTEETGRLQSMGSQSRTQLSN